MHELDSIAERIEHVAPDVPVDRHVVVHRDTRRPQSGHGLVERCHQQRGMSLASRPKISFTTDVQSNSVALEPASSVTRQRFGLGHPTQTEDSRIEGDGLVLTTHGNGDLHMVVAGDSHGHDYVALTSTQQGSTRLKEEPRRASTSRAPGSAKSSVGSRGPRASEAIASYLAGVPNADGDRSKHFPAIEKKHGEPIAVWIERLRALGNVKYVEQMEFLQNRHGFSRTHANALVMIVRGSESSKRFASPDSYFASIDPRAARTARAVFAVVRDDHPELDLVIAWNQPILRNDKGYVLGISTSKGHLTLNPFSKAALAAGDPLLGDLTSAKHTVRIPLDWKPDLELLRTMVRTRLGELR